MTYAKYMAWKYGIIIATVMLLVGVPSLIYLVTVLFGINDSKDVCFLVSIGSILIDVVVAALSIDNFIELENEYKCGRH